MIKLEKFLLIILVFSNVTFGALPQSIKWVRLRRKTTHSYTTEKTYYDVELFIKLAEGNKLKNAKVLYNKDPLIDLSKSIGMMEDLGLGKVLLTRDLKDPMSSGSYLVEIDLENGGHFQQWVDINYNSYKKYPQILTPNKPFSNVARNNYAFRWGNLANELKIGNAAVSAWVRDNDHKGNDIWYSYKNPPTFTNLPIGKIPLPSNSNLYLGVRYDIGTQDKNIKFVDIYYSYIPFKTGAL